MHRLCGHSQSKGGESRVLPKDTFLWANLTPGSQIPNLSAASSLISASFPSIPRIGQLPIQVLVLSPKGSPQNKGHGLGSADLPEDVMRDVSGGNCKAASQQELWSHLELGAGGNLTASPIHCSKCSADQSQTENNTF